MPLLLPLQRHMGVDVCRGGGHEGRARIGHEDESLCACKCTDHAKLSDLLS